eukprot:Sspe_Gene.16697::Locus_5898_Transcript_2_3_Confidence_0.571_Length_1402::g.16697::m.16697
MEELNDEALARFAPKDKNCSVPRDVGKRWFDAARYGDCITVEDLLPLFPDLVNYGGGGTSYGFIGSTALHWAASRGDLKMMNLLIDKGSDPSFQNNGGSTPLHSAAANGQVGAVELLLAKGSNPQLIDCCGDTPEDVAQPEKEKPIREVIRKRKVEVRLRGTDPSQWKVSDMKEALQAGGIDYRGMTERTEMVEAVSSLLAAYPAPEPPASVKVFREEQQGVADDDEVDEDALASANDAKEKGNAAYRDGDTKTAIRWYTMAIKLNPNDAAFYANRAAAYMALRKFSMALDDSKKAVAISPEWPKGHYRKGCALYHLGQPMEALWAFNTALKLSPTPSADLVQAFEQAREAVAAAQGGYGGYEEEEEEEERYRSPSPPPKKERHAWFDCVLCDNRTRDHRLTACCSKDLCGTCYSRKCTNGCPYGCGGKP